MGCSISVLVKKNKKMKSIPEIAVFVPTIRVPIQSDLYRSLKGVVPKTLVERLHSLRNQIQLVAHQTDGSATAELIRVLEEYLPVLIGLTKKEYGLEESIEFRWKYLDGHHHEASMSDSWFEVLSVVHMMAMVTLSEANSLMVPMDGDRGMTEPEPKTVPSDCKRESVDLLLKASGYLDFCIREILNYISFDHKKKLPTDLQEGVLQAISIQALGQGTEIQLGLAVESQNASLSVRRRLACEQLSYFSQAHVALSDCDPTHRFGKKHIRFIKWKFLEAKAAAYYYHGLVVDKGNDPSDHISAVCCFLAAQELLEESKKTCLSFCLAEPVSRIPPYWGAIKHLNQKIPEAALKKSQMYGYLLEQEEKILQTLPDLPEFELSLRPDVFELPEMDSSWDRKNWEIESHSLKDYLKDYE